jgi:hypothetical protein
MSINNISLINMYAYSAYGATTPPASAPAPAATRKAAAPAVPPSEIDTLLPELETFSMSLDGKGRFFALNPGTFSRRQQKTYDLSESSSNAEPIDMSPFQDKTNILYAVKKLLEEVGRRDNAASGGAYKTPPMLLREFQEACVKNQIETNINGTTNAAQLVANGVLDRQNVRALVVVCYLGRLAVAFGLVKNFDAYLKSFYNDPQEFGKIVQKIKGRITRIGGTLRLKTQDYETEAAIKGNNSEIIIDIYSRYSRGQIKSPTLENIKKSLSLILSSVGQGEADQFRYIPAVIEAKKILYCFIKEDGSRMFGEGTDGDFDGSWPPDFEAALKEFTGSSVIDAKTAASLITACLARVENIRRDLFTMKGHSIHEYFYKKTIRTMKFASYPGLNDSLISSLKSEFTRIKNLKGYDPVSRLFLIDRYVASIYIGIIFGKAADEAKKRLAVLKSVMGKIGTVIEEMKNSGIPADPNYVQFVQTENVVVSRIESEIATNPGGAMNDAGNAIRVCYEKYVALITEYYRGKYRSVEEEIRKINANDPNARSRIGGIALKIGELRALFDRQQGANTEAAPYGVEPLQVTDPNGLSPIIARKAVEIAEEEKKAANFDRYFLELKKCINAAVVEICVNARTAEIEEIIRKLQAGDRWDNLGAYYETKAAGDELLYVRGWIDEEVKAAYRSTDVLKALNDMFKGYVDGFIGSLKDEIIERKNCAFTVGDADIVSETEVRIVGPSRHDLYYLDLRPVEMKIAGSYSGSTADDVRKYSYIRQYFRLCSRILANREAFRELLERAKKGYDERIKGIVDEKEEYLVRSSTKVLGDMSFEDCLRAEIRGRRLSFAGAALAKAFEEINNPPAAGSQPPRVPYMRGVSVKLIEDLASYIAATTP